MEILSLGEKIKRQRKNLGMTLKDLAGERITPGQISLVESGKSNPSMDLLEYLANSLDTSIEYLMESEETQAEKICTYYENIAESYILNGDYVQGEQYIENALYYAEKYNLEYRKARNLYLRGVVSFSKNELAISQQFLLSANVIFIKECKFEEIVNTFLKLGSIALKLKAYYSACSYFQQAEKAYMDNDIGNDFLLGEIYYYISYTYYKLENLDNAINYSYLANEKFKQLSDKKQYGKSLLLISKEFSEKGDLDNALKYSKRTLKIFESIGNDSYIGEIENNLGKLFYSFDNLEESFVHLNKAKKIRQDLDDGKIVDTLVNICENYIKLKDVENCKKILKEIMGNVERKDEKALMYYYLLKYRVDVLEDNLQEAETSLHLALKYVKDMEYFQEAGEISIMIGKFYIDNGKDVEAARYLSEGVDFFKKTGVLKEL